MGTACVRAGEFALSLSPWEIFYFVSFRKLVVINQFCDSGCLFIYL